MNSIPPTHANKTAAVLNKDLARCVDQTVSEVAEALTAAQRDDGHWLFELEADCTIPAEYIMLGHFLDEIDTGTEAKLATYIRSRQGSHGGWPLFHEGDLNISCSVKAYFALKLAGDDPDAPHMARARAAILALGGAARSNVFTRIALALFDQVPWRAVPTMPVEIMLLPRWFPFHLDKTSYWSRTVIAPLMVLMTLKPHARNPLGIDIRELFTVPPEDEKHYFANRGAVERGFRVIDRILRRIDPILPKTMRECATERAVAFITERLNGAHGLGAIFPAMANALMAFDTLGYARDHPDRAMSRKAIDKLLVFDGDSGYCQPCVSPIWDTALAGHAMLEARDGETTPAIAAALTWLRDRQITEGPADWRARRPNLAPGGWAFQYANAHYPDVDDTAVVLMALDRSDHDRYRTEIARGAAWLEGMQSADGGWGSFDVDNTHTYLNHIPFADHGALLDPPTEDVTARCVSALCQIGWGSDHPVVARGLDFLRKTQQADGSWFGRWGTNYIYGTWSVLCALSIAGDDPRSPSIRRAVAWLESRQRDDGGWGEDGATYWEERRDEAKTGTPSQTAWALLALMAAGEVASPAVRRGIAYLLQAPREGARWREDYFTAVGFPRVFYLRYHGYAAYFPLWALARYRNLRHGNTDMRSHGM